MAAPFIGIHRTALQGIFRYFSTALSCSHPGERGFCEIEAASDTMSWLHLQLGVTTL